MKISCQKGLISIKYVCCAKWGVSGALYLQSAIAEPNTAPGSACGRPRSVRDVDFKVLCNELP